ncbi:MAG: hypothetical protein KF720_04920 [Rubrivivax sp.]|nr:hypothetical protein [Rubrivivax sp.]
MKNQTLEAMIWVCIYAGLFVLGIGVWFSRHHLAAGVTLLCLGGALVAAGVLLIWLRSRRPS